jgi:hypothetical protein
MKAIVAPPVRKRLNRGELINTNRAHIKRHKKIVASLSGLETLRYIPRPITFT